MVENGDAEGPTGLGELPCNRPIFGRRSRISRWVVVHQNDARRALPHRQPEDLARVDEGRVENTPGDEHLPQHAVSGVEQEGVELFLASILKARADAAKDVGGSTDRRVGWRRFGR